MYCHLGVCKNSGTPKWKDESLFIRENPIRIDDLAVPLFLETPICLKKTAVKSDFSAGFFKHFMPCPVGQMADEYPFETKTA